MYFKNFIKLFGLIFFGLSIYSMEQKSLISSNESKAESNIFSANTNQDSKILKLHKLAFKRVEQILQQLTFEDEPAWILETLPPTEVEDEIKKEFIRNNGSAWWYCFGTNAQFNELSYSLENGSQASYILILPGNNRLISLDFLKKNMVIKVFSLETFEYTHYGLIDMETLIKSNLENINLDIELKCVKNEESSIKLKLSELKTFCSADEEKSKIHNRGHCFYKSRDLKNYSWFEFSIKNDDNLSKFCLPNIKYDETIDLDKFQNFLSEIMTGFMPQILRGFYRSDDCKYVSHYDFKVRLRSNKKIVITVFRDVLKIWNLETLECINTIESPHHINNFQLSKDDAFMLIQSLNVIEIIDIDSLKKIHTINNTQQIQAVSMSQDGTILAILSSSECDNKIRIVSLNNLLNKLAIGQLTFIKILYDEYKKNSYVEIRSNSIWTQILKSFDSDIQQLIFEKFNLRISCNN